jgi:heme A synthase
MWTVTWKLKPIVVMGHLLGGMATMAHAGVDGACVPVASTAAPR